MSKLKIDLDQEDRRLVVECDPDGKVRVTIVREFSPAHVAVLDLCVPKADGKQGLAA